METNERNALAELAEGLDFTLKGILDEGRYNFPYLKKIRKAQRIVAELAKVEDVTEVHKLELVQRPNPWECYDAVVKCRAIAEEGEA